MEQRVERLEEHVHELAKQFNKAELRRERDLGLLYVQITSIQSDMKVIKWFAGVTGAAVIIYLISLLAERVWM